MLLLVGFSYRCLYRVEHDTTTGYGHMIARQIKDKKGKGE